MIHLDNGVDKFWDTKTICEKRDARFIGYLPKNGDTLLRPTFWQKEPHPRGSNFFTLTDYGHANMFISDGIWVTQRTFVGVRQNDGSICYSRHRHDYRTTSGGGTIDGGDAYTRYSLGEGERIISFTITEEGFPIELEYKVDINSILEESN